MRQVLEMKSLRAVSPTAEKILSIQEEEKTTIFCLINSIMRKFYKFFAGMMAVAAISLGSAPMAMAQDEGTQYENYDVYTENLNDFVECSQYAIVLENKLNTINETYAEVIAGDIADKYTVCVETLNVVFNTLNDIDLSIQDAARAAEESGVYESTVAEAIAEVQKHACSP